MVELQGGFSEEDERGRGWDNKPTRRTHHSADTLRVCRQRQDAYGTFRCPLLLCAVRAESRSTILSSSLRRLSLVLGRPDHLAS